MNTIVRTIQAISQQARAFHIPVVNIFSAKQDPFLVLISCILSLRTKDRTTREASMRLFEVADTPQKMLRLTPGRLQKLIYPVGFYRTKAKVILGISRKIIQDFGGKVPNTLEDLLKFRGVGRKTANLVLGLGYGIPAICVDTHVHRISNRLGWVTTKVPEETEEALKNIVPQRLWIDLNTLLVAFGQNICVPVSPFCSQCRVRKWCKRKEVSKSR